VNALLRRVHIPDLLFFSLVIFLASLGLVMVYSSSSVSALDHFGDSWFYLKRQAVFLAAGFSVMFLVLASDYHKWVRYGGWLLLASILSLMLIYVPGIGYSAGGALRWISLGGIGVQPAEFAKLACIVYMTWALVRKGENASSFTYGLLPMGIVAGLLAGLILMQPDFGNAVVLVFLAGVMVFLAGARISYLISVVLFSLPLVWALVMGKEYRRRRLMAFLDPWADMQNTSYQIVQSFTAFSQGGLWGSGLGNSREKLYYLPEVHTDFIGSVIGEELGFFGMALLAMAFALLVIRGYRIAMRAADPTGFLLASGCTTLIGIQAVLNLFVIMGLVPTKGLPLPFLSHGGSALITTFFACGMIQSVGRQAVLEGPLPSYPWLRKWGLGSPARVNS
jgi:cell division protein FtsW